MCASAANLIAVVCFDETAAGALGQVEPSSLSLSVFLIFLSRLARPGLPGLEIRGSVHQELSRFDCARVSFANDHKNSESVK